MKENKEAHEENGTFKIFGFEELEESGMAFEQEKKGYYLCPTHEFYLIKRIRGLRYHKEKNIQLKLNRIDLATFNKVWLTNEVKYFEKVEKYRKKIFDEFSIVDRVEIQKYLDWVENKLGLVDNIQLNFESNEVDGFGLSQIEDEIQSAFVNIDSKGWKYIFYQENEFISFLSLLTHFFEKKEYELPKVIKVKPRCQTKLASAIGDIYANWGSVLARDKKFISIVRVLSCFSKTPEKDIIKRMQS